METTKTEGDFKWDPPFEAIDTKVFSVPNFYRSCYFSITVFISYGQILPGVWSMSSFSTEELALLEEFKIQVKGMKNSFPQTVINVARLS